MIRNRNNENEKAGYVLTPQRELILKTLKNYGGILDARELFKLVSEEDRSISLATVYRSLNLFKECGLIDEHRMSKGRCCFELKQSIEHQRAMCKSCGKIIRFESPLITDLMKKLQEEQNFYIEKVDMCIQGFCGECREKQETIIKKQETKTKENPK
jgi:Fur family transcriptional regulator, ferric uptake regulator